MQTYPRLEHNVPNTEAPIADLQTGRITRAWYLALLAEFQILQEKTIAVSGSPFSFIATDTGHLLVVGGTVSSITLSRVGTYATGITSGFVPMSEGDTITITYTVAPTLVFFPK
jgi:hypothetical protein